MVGFVRRGDVRKETLVIRQPGRPYSERYYGVKTKENGFGRV
jgi:hypothetical protein